MYCVSLVLGKDVARLHDGSSRAAHAVWPGQTVDFKQGRARSCLNLRPTQKYEDEKCFMTTWKTNFNASSPLELNRLPEKWRDSREVWHVLFRLHMMAIDFEYVAEYYFPLPPWPSEKFKQEKKVKVFILFLNNNLEFGLAADDFSFKLRNLLFCFPPPSIFCVTSGRYTYDKEREREREICT